MKLTHRELTILCLTGIQNTLRSYYLDKNFFDYDLNKKEIENLINKLENELIKKELQK